MSMYRWKVYCTSFCECFCEACAHHFDGHVLHTDSYTIREIAFLTTLGIPWVGLPWNVSLSNLVHVPMVSTRNRRG